MKRSKRSLWRRLSKDEILKEYENRGKYPGKERRGYTTNPDIFWNCEEGPHKIRLIPPHPADEDIRGYGLMVHLHRDVGANGDIYLCPKLMKGDRCPICEHQKTIWESDPEVAKQLFPNLRYLIWIADLTDGEDNANVLLWSCPKTVYDDIVGLSYRQATGEVINLADIDEGFCIYFKRVGKGIKTRYKDFQIDTEPYPVPDEWLEEIIPFKDILVYHSYEEIKSSFFGIEDEKEESEIGFTSQEENTELSELEDENEDEDEDEENDNKSIDIDNMTRDELEELAISKYGLDEDEVIVMSLRKLKKTLKELEEKEEEDIKTRLRRRLR